MSTLAITDGPPEREAVHSWAGGSGVVLNARGDGVWPRLEIASRILGYRDRPDAEDETADLASRIGVVSRPGLQRARVLTYPLMVKARSLPEMRAGQSRLLGAFSDTWNHGEMFIAPVGDFDGPLWAYSAKSIGLTAGDEQIGHDLLAGGQPAPFQIAYTLSLRMDDPRYYTGAGGTLDPELADLVGVTSAVCHNLGNAPSDPIITVNSPFDAVVEVRNQTLGTYVIFNLGFPFDIEGAQLIFDFAKRSVLITLGEINQDVTAFVERGASTWWQAGQPGLLPAGVTTIQVVGANGGTVAWRHAAWG